MSTEQSHTETSLEATQGPLAGIRVIEWSVWHQGAAVGYLMGDLGADVIKIEEPVHGDPLRGTYRFMGVPIEVGESNSLFELANRSKRSVCLDLRTTAGQRILHELVATADVFVTNFHRPATRERVSADYATLSRINPRLVYAVCSGQGRSGADADLSAFDNIAVARSGFMYSIGEQGSPPQPMVFGLADQIGATLATYGIMAALLSRTKSGRGQELHVSLLGAMVHAQALAVSSALMLGSELPRPSRTDVFNPLTTYYRCADDRWIAFSMQQPQDVWAEFCEAIDAPELTNDPRFATTRARGQYHQELVQLIDLALARKTSTEWVEIFRRRRFVFGPVQRISDLWQDEQVRANDYLVEMEHPHLGRVKVLGFPVQFSETPAAIQRAAPTVGQHTEEVMESVLGYTWPQISDLRANGAFG